MRRHARACLCVCALWMGCASAQQKPVAAPTPAFTRLDAAEAERVRALAPDLGLRAEAALHDADVAEDAGDAQAALEHRTRASLWTEAALAEAERIEHMRARDAAEAASQRSAAERAALDAERVEAVRATQRLQAGRVARAQAERMFAEAALDEEARRGTTQDRAAARAKVAPQLLARVQLSLAAAAGMGASETSRQRAEVALESARAAKPGTVDALNKAQQAQALADLALGEARAISPAPTAAQTTSLLAAATERGMPSGVTERGVVMELASLFAPAARTLTARGRSVLEHVQSLLRAFPHGQVQLELVVEVGADAARAKLCAARADALTLQLESTLRGRVTFAREACVRGAEQTRLAWLAYATAPLTGAAPTAP
jgi:hypothetical protein